MLEYTKSEKKEWKKTTARRNEIIRKLENTSELSNEEITNLEKELNDIINVKSQYKKISVNKIRKNQANNDVHEDKIIKNTFNMK